MNVTPIIIHLIRKQTREELLVFHRAPPQVTDGGMLTRYGGYRRNKIPGGEGPKLALLPCSLVLEYQGLEEDNLDQKSPDPPGWGLMQQVSPMLIEKKKITKKPTGNYNCQMGAGRCGNIVQPAK